MKHNNQNPYQRSFAFHKQKQKLSNTKQKQERKPTSDKMVSKQHAQVDRASTSKSYTSGSYAKSNQKTTNLASENKPLSIPQSDSSFFTRLLNEKLKIRAEHVLHEERKAELREIEVKNKEFLLQIHNSILEQKIENFDLRKNHERELTSLQSLLEDQKASNRIQAISNASLQSELKLESKRHNLQLDRAEILYQQDSHNQSIKNKVQDAEIKHLRNKVDVFSSISKLDQQLNRLPSWMRDINL